MTEYLGIRAAARALNLSHSTVSRHVRAYPGLNHGTDAQPMVDVEEFREHRAENINQARSGSHAGRLLGEEVKTEGIDAREDVTKPNGTDLTVLGSERLRDLSESADAKALKNAEKRRLLVPVSEVESGASDAAQAVQNALMGVGMELSERLAAMTEAREIAALIEAEHKKILERLSMILDQMKASDVAA